MEDKTSKFDPAAGNGSYVDRERDERARERAVTTAKVVAEIAAQTAASLAETFIKVRQAEAALKAAELAAQREFILALAKIDPALAKSQMLDPGTVYAAGLEGAEQALAKLGRALHR